MLSIKEEMLKICPKHVDRSPWISSDNHKEDPVHKKDLASKIGC